MKTALFVVVLLIVGTASACAQLEDADAATQAKCAEYLKTPLPAEATQMPNQRTWPACSSVSSYLGVGRRRDYAAARKCAWEERLAIQAGLEPRYTVDSVLGGSAMLTVLYANGQGVERDKALALRFACEAGGAPAEIALRLRDLDSLKPTDPSHFGFCDDITSGFMEGFCAAYGTELADQERSESLKAIARRMTPDQRAAFERMLQAEGSYARAHAAGEIDLSGTARGMYQIDAEETLRDDLLAALRQFDAGTYPSGSAEDYRWADTRLNSAYGQALHDAQEHETEYGAVQPEGIREAERAWLKYRDAWVVFAGLRYRQVPSTAWLVMLTKDRTSVLNGSFCDMDDVDGPCAWHGDRWKPSPLL